MSTVTSVTIEVTGGRLIGPALIHSSRATDALAVASALWRWAEQRGEPITPEEARDGDLEIDLIASEGYAPDWGAVRRYLSEIAGSTPEVS